MRQQGITFTVYGREQGVERIIPFDPIPRLIDAEEWTVIERGLEQRVRALNLFIGDVYQQRRILKDRVVPRRAGLRGLGISPAVRRAPGPSRHLHPCLRHRPDPRQRRPLPGPGGQLPDALRSQLRPQEPAGHEGGLPAPVRAVQRAAGRRLHGQPLGRAPMDRAGSLRRPDRRGPEPRHLQLGLLRAQLPRPADGRRAGGRARPAARPGPGLPAHDPRPPSSRCDLPTDR